MPEEYDDEHHNREKMSRLEELVAHVPSRRQLYFRDFDNPHHLPKHTVRRKREPGLENERDDTSPVEQCVHHGDLHDHIVPSNVVHDERKSVHEGEHKEGVCGPSMEDLYLLMRDSGDEGDPVCLACGRAVMCQYLNRVWALGKRTRRTAYMPAPASPTECPVAVSRRSLHSASSTVVG